jgi:hypothetical protein
MQEASMKSKIIILILCLLVSLSAEADNYEVSVTRKGSNIYKVDGENLLVQTRYCYEYVYYEESFLKMNGYSGEIIFTESASKCDVKAVFGLSEQDAGRYSVTINHDDDDWYEVWGQDVYIKTSLCLSLALGEEAVLTLSEGGFGTLYVGDDECMVEGLYSKLTL